METTLDIVAVATLVSLVVGGVGSIIEKVGMELDHPKLQAVGKTLESIAGDLPKFITNVWSLLRK